MVDISARRILWILVGLFASVVAVLFLCAGLTISFGSNHLFLWMAAAILCLAYRPPEASWQQKLLDSLEFTALLSLTSVIGAAGTYAIAALSTGYMDDVLAAADRAIGFDWVGLYALTSAYPWLGMAGKLSYVSIFISPVLLLLAFAWTGRRLEARRLIFAFGVALALTLLIFAFVPARAALDYYMGSNPAYMPHSGNYHVWLIEALRSGAVTHVDGSNFAGLVAFPSFHTASAILFIWAAWPIRWLRAPLLALNLAMLASIPIEGGHYLVDMVAGAVVAMLGIASLRLIRTGPATAPEMHVASAAATVVPPVALR
jgi:hypothetical protein